MKRSFSLLGCAALWAMSGAVSAAQLLAERTIEADAASVAPLVEGKDPQFAPPKAEPVKVEPVTAVSPKVELPIVEQGNNETPKTDLPKGEMTRAVFSKQIVNKEPQEEVTELGGDIQRVYFFSEVTNMAGHMVTHRWEYDGAYMGEVKFNVQSAKWRAWSYKTVSGGKGGTWNVKVLNTAGDVVGEKSIAPRASP